MMRPAGSRVRHGMPSCARYGCKRTECVEAQRRANRENYHGLKEGGARIPADEVMKYGAKLLSAGMSAVDISNRSGVSATQVRMLLRGKLERVHRITAEAILGIPMPDEDRLPETDGLVDATGARRRLQALSVQGFPVSFMTEETGMTGRTISIIRAGDRPQVRVSRHRMAVHLHDKYWDVDPLDLCIADSAVTRAKQWASQQGWYPTEAWADIDDPDCKPVLSTPRYVVLTEDAQELMEKQGYTRKAAAERLGVKVDTLNAAMAYYAKAKAAS